MLVLELAVSQFLACFLMLGPGSPGSEFDSVQHTEGRIRRFVPRKKADLKAGSLHGYIVNGNIDRPKKGFHCRHACRGQPRLFGDGYVARRVGSVENLFP